MDKLVGIKFPFNISMFIEFHPSFWGIGYFSGDQATSITLACFSVGVEY